MATNLLRSPDASPTLNPYTIPRVTLVKPTRWFRRTLLALVAAGLAWWAVRELVQPQPQFSFHVNKDSSISDALKAGSWFLLETTSSAGLISMQVAIYDLEKGTITKHDGRFGSYGFQANTVRYLKTALNRYLIHQPTTASIALHDTTTDNTSTTHHFPNSTLQVNNDSTTLLQSTVLPVAPFTALSPAPWSAVSTALLMSCDAQRLYGYAIGPTLVQIKSLPSLTVQSSYMLPMHVELRTLQLSADGNYLLHGFSPDRLPYASGPGPGPFFRHQDVRPISQVIPGGMRIWKRLFWMFPESQEFLRSWSANSDKKFTTEDKYTDTWVDTDLTDIWPDLSTTADVYHAHTGQLLYHTTIEKDGQPVPYRCIHLQQDWAFLSTMPPQPDNRVDYHPLPRLLALHLPTGHKVNADQLPDYLWANGAKLFATHLPGTALAVQTLSVLPSPYRSSPRFTHHPFLLSADGHGRQLSRIPSNLQDLCIPHTNQMVVEQSLLDKLPAWLHDYIHRWPWLNNKLRSTWLSVIDTATNSTLWNLPTTTIESGSANSISYTLHRPRLSTDGQLLLVPIKQLDSTVLYHAYALPLSKSLPTHPRLAALITFLLIMSQGIKRLRLPGSPFPTGQKG